MGAAEYFEFVPGHVNDPGQAYSLVRQQAREEFGYDTYSGTIGQSNGYRIASRVGRTLADLTENRDHLEVSGKGGPASAYPVLASDTDRKVVVKNVTVRAGDRMRPSPRDVEAPDGYKFVSVETAVNDVQWGVKQQATKGERVTRYIIEGHPQHGTWQTGFKSQADARSYLERTMTNLRVTTVDTLSEAAYEKSSCGIVAATRRRNGDALVTTERVLKKAKLTHTYTFERIGQDHNDAGWVFVGWAPN